MQNKVIALCFLVTLFVSCGTVQNTVKTSDSIKGSELPDASLKIDHDFQVDENLLFLKGLRIPAPSGCSFKSDYLNTGSFNKIRIVKADYNILTLQGFEYSFDYNKEKVKSYYAEQLSKKYEITENGILDIPGRGGGTAADYWTVSDKNKKYSIVYEESPAGCFEWIVNSELKKQQRCE